MANIKFEPIRVLRRGAPMEYMSTRRSPRGSTELEVLHDTYMRAGDSLDEITVAYRRLFEYTERAILSGDTCDVHTVHPVDLMNCLVSGDTECALMGLYEAWSKQRAQERNPLRDQCLKRLNREERRIAQIYTATGTSEDIHSKAPTLHGWEEEVGIESLRLTAHTLGLLTVRSLFDGAVSQPPHRGIKEVGNYRDYLAKYITEFWSAYKDTDDPILLRESHGAVTEAEILLALYIACGERMLDGCWPIQASQRLDIGKYRPYDSMNTDILAMFPGKNSIVPIQVKSDETILPGEGSSICVLRIKDLYPHGSRLSYGDLALLYSGEGSAMTHQRARGRIEYIANKVLHFANNTA